MKYRWDKKYLYWGFTIFTVILMSLCSYYLMFHGINLKRGFFTIIAIFMPVIDGLALAYLLTPIVNKLETKILLPICKKKGWKTNGKNRKRIRALSISITVVLVFIIAYQFFSLIIPEILRSIQSIINQFPIYVNNMNNWLQNIMSNNAELESIVTNLFTTYSKELQSWLDQSLLPQINEVVKTVSISLLGFFKALWNLIIGLILSIYIISSKEMFTGQFKKIVYSMVETKTANQFIDNVRFTHRTFSGFLGGKIVDSIIIGFICFIGTSIMNNPYAILISVIIGVTNIIPFFGPYLGAIPSALLLLMVDPLQCLYFIIFILFLQQFDGNILGPKILGNSTGLSSFWVIVSITVFGGFFGILGMFIGVPTFAVIYAAFRTIVNRNLEKKGLPIQTSLYLNVSEIQEKELLDIIPTEKSSKMNSTLWKIYADRKPKDIPSKEKDNDNDKDKL